MNKNFKIKSILILTISIFALSGCKNNTETICSVSDYTKITEQCMPGDTLFFAPKTFGNEQLPLVIAASACDMGKNVVWNIGGLVCTMSNPKESRE